MIHFPRLLLGLVLLLLVIGSSIAVRLVKLTALRCKGKFIPASESKEVSAAFLSQGKLEVLESDDDDSNEAILCDLMPVPLFDSRGEKLVTTLLTTGLDPYTVGAILVNRDNGLYDNIPWDWKGKGSRAKLDLYNELQQIRIEQKFKANPELAFFIALNDVLNSKITGLFFEIRDELSTNSVSLGAAIIVSKNEVANEWKLSRANNALPAASSTDADIRDHDACVVNCHPDELLALSVLLKLPIYMPEPLFESSAIDARLINYEEESTTSPEEDDSPNDQKQPIPTTSSTMTIYAPVFRSASQRAAWSKRGENNNNNNKKEPKAKDIIPAWEIYDPKKFLTMSSVEKRAVLRASGVTSLPRPREGVDPLDRALVDKMDEAVRGEVLRILASQYKESDSKGGRSSTRDTDTTTNNVFMDGYSDNTSLIPTTGRQAKLQALGQALEDGDMETAERLREEFMVMTDRLADPTQAKGSYDKYLDQDEWYMEQRRKAMAPKKNK